MITVIDPSFEKLIDPNVQAETIGNGFQFTEGPLWDSKENRLIFSDIQADTMYAWTEDRGCEIFRKPSGRANGNTYDREGRLIACEHQTRRVSRTLSDGKVETLVDNYTGKKLNSPNDVICSSKGDLYPRGVPEVVSMASTRTATTAGIAFLATSVNALEVLRSAAKSSSAVHSLSAGPKIIGNNKAKPNTLIPIAFLLLPIPVPFKPIPAEAALVCPQPDCRVLAQPPTDLRQ